MYPHRSPLVSRPFISQTLAVRHNRYYKIIKKPVERLGYSHRWGGRPGFSNLRNMECQPCPITCPDLPSSHRYRVGSSGVHNGGRGRGSTECDGTMSAAPKFGSSVNSSCCCGGTLETKVVMRFSKHLLSSSLVYLSASILLQFTLAHDVYALDTHSSNPDLIKNTFPCQRHSKHKPSY